MYSNFLKVCNAWIFVLKICLLACVSLRLMTSQIKGILNNRKSIGQQNAHFLKYGLQVLSKISMEPFDISYEILNPCPTKYACYEVPFFTIYDIFKLRHPRSEWDGPLNGYAVQCVSYDTISVFLKWNLLINMVRATYFSSLQSRARYPIAYLSALPLGWNITIRGNIKGTLL